MAQPAIAQTHVPPRDPESFNTRGRATIVETDRSIEGDRAKFLAASGEHLPRYLETRDFARCAIGSSPERARQLLDQSRSDYRGARLTTAEFVGRSRACLGPDYKLDPDLLKGAIAEDLVARRSGSPGGPASGSQVGDFIRSIALAGNPAEDPLARSQAAVECRTALAPAAARSVIATEPGSTAELGALAAIKAATPQCDALAPGGTPISQIFQRAFAAQALYHWWRFAGEGE